MAYSIRDFKALDDRLVCFEKPYMTHRISPSVVASNCSNLNIIPVNATSSEIEWISSNEEIAIVEDGVVTALKAGKASISALASNGVRTKCYVTVSDKDILAFAVVLGIV